MSTLEEALSQVWADASDRGLGGALGMRPAAPASQVRVRGRMHSKAPDRSVISHHYDLSKVRDVHALREHHVRTVEAWIDRFEAHQDTLRSLVPEEVLRVWRLHLRGDARAFRDGRMGVDQILAVRPGPHDLPVVRAW